MSKRYVLIWWGTLTLHHDRDYFYNYFNIHFFIFTWIGQSLLRQLFIEAIFFCSARYPFANQYLVPLLKTFVKGKPNSVMILLQNRIEPLREGLEFSSLYIRVSHFNMKVSNISIICVIPCFSGLHGRCSPMWRCLGQEANSW